MFSGFKLYRNQLMLWVSCWLVPWMSLQAQSDSLTLDKAITQVLAAHPQLQESVYQTQAAEAQISQAKSGLYPTVQAEATYNYLHPISYILFPGADGSFSKLNFNPANNFSAGLSARYTLYDFGQTRSRIELSNTSKTLTEEQQKIIRQELSLATIQCFYGILLFQDGIQVQDEQLRNLRQNLEEIQARITNETATDFDLLTTQVRIANTENQKNDLIRSKQNLEIQLKQLLGMPATSVVVLQGDFTDAAYATDEQMLIDQALGQRSESTLSTMSIKLAQQQRALLGLGNRPSLTANASAGYKNGYQPDIYKVRFNYMAGAALTIPIFSGYRVRSQVQEAEFRLKASESSAENVKRNITVEVQQALATLSNAKARLKTSQVQVAQAEEAARQARLRFQNELITNLDLLDVQLAVAQAELNYLQARHDYTIGTYQLKKAAGEKVW